MENREAFVNIIWVAWSSFECRNSDPHECSHKKRNKSLESREVPEEHTGIQLLLIVSDCALRLWVGGNNKYPAGTLANLLRARRDTPWQIPRTTATRSVSIFGSSPEYGVSPKLTRLPFHRAYCVPQKGGRVQGWESVC